MMIIQNHGDFEFRYIPCPHVDEANLESAFVNNYTESILIEDTATHATNIVLCQVCYGVITGHVLRDVFSDSMKAIAEKVARETLSNVQVNGMYKARRGV